ncbi:amidohydrolase [Desulfomonile tiedjei]|uniref:Amidohydrolase n=1 Tax=Desulfomonile tiedjei (strain ATCC 49306 / DSM 6799 / DCB-1) TaxID=706587 RepID=I4C9A4_DESTA|nr:amidohydrolase [Desulfomonile tiedjei]AFM26145.1 amidohydrolase [Desulfomonile tiedjei DSM 6799]
MTSEIGLKWVNEHSERLIETSDKLWEFAETALHEYQSSDLLQGELKQAGFEVETGVAGMPTAFRARWGNGTPTVGFLAEYDALPGLSQKSVPRKEPMKEGAPGHGCGHNLLGTAVLGAALALKAEMEQDNLSGTIVVFGCPAEEIMVGKIVMAREGLFDELDVALTWHPQSLNGVMNCGWVAMNSVKFDFHGITSHAAFAPEMGRSALDAVELMNVGVNYLREHVSSNARIHYVITNGGREPNIVPGYAQVWYYIRAPKREEVDAIYARIKDIAEGAALMAGTKVEARLLTACHDCLLNTSLNRHLSDSMQCVASPVWSEEELRFARELTQGFDANQRMRQISIFTRDNLEGHMLHSDVLPLNDTHILLPGSTDVSDVSWIVPTGQIMTACYPIGIPPHSWQLTASVSTSIGHKGMLYAAKVLVKAASELIREAGLLARVKAEHLKNTSEKKYVCALPEDFSLSTVHLE